MTRATRMPKDELGHSVPVLLPVTHDAGISATYSAAGAHVVVIATAGNSSHNTKPFRPETKAVRLYSAEAFFFSVTDNTSLTVLSTDTATTSEIHHRGPAGVDFDISILNSRGDPVRWPYIRLTASANGQKIYITEFE